MGVQRGAGCRICRREGEKLFLKGDRCSTAKCAFLKRAYPPGQHGMEPKKMSDYATRLREKQRAKRYYSLSEGQFRKNFEVASKAKGVTGTLFLQMIEMMLYNVIYTSGLADSRIQARQLVKHGHVLVNGRKVNIPSYLTKAGDVFTVKTKSKAFQTSLEKIKNMTLPAWLSFNVEVREGKILNVPSREEINVPVSEQLIVEFYSK